MTTQDSTIPSATGRKDYIMLVSRLFSSVFSPLLVPTYGILLAFSLSVLCLLPGAVRWGVTAVVFVATCIIPMVAILALWKLKIVSDPGLNNRTERTIPYIITGLCYLACGIYLWRLHAPEWLYAFMFGGAIAVGVCIVVNRWWKISAHMAANAGLLAVVMRILSEGVAASPTAVCVWLTIVCLACGCVGTSRLILQRHTLGQVAAGTLVGFLAVYLL